MRPHEVHNTSPKVFFVAGVLLFALSAYAQTGLPPTAEQTRRTVSASGNQGDPDLVTEAKELYRHGHFDEANQRYEQLLQAQPKSAEAYAGLTRVHLRLKKVRLAHDTISRGLQSWTLRPCALLWEKFSFVRVSFPRRRANGSAWSTQATRMPAPI